MKSLSPIKLYSLTPIHYFANIGWKLLERLALKESCYKRGKKPRYKPKPKHLLEVHVWAGISYWGRLILCIFEGKMNALLNSRNSSTC